MSDTKQKREIHGYTMSGERVCLGQCDMTDAEVKEFLNGIAEIYSDEKRSPAFSVRSAVFNASAFSGIWITPPHKIGKGTTQ